VFFENFQVEDDEVIQMLEATYPLHKCHTNHYSKNGHHEKLELDIPLTHVTLKGNLIIPEEAAVNCVLPWKW
jgi:hypothetical protein